MAKNQGLFCFFKNHFTTRENKESTPFGAMPLLEGVPGIQAPICQSRAIIRHCARLAGIEGETEVDKLLADMFADTGHEWLERLFCG